MAHVLFSEGRKLVIAMYRHMIRRKLPYIAFTLCILIQIRIIYTVPKDDTENTTCKEKTTDRKPNVERSVFSQYFDDRVNHSVRKDWMNISRNLLSIPPLNKSSVMLKTGLDYIRESSHAFGFSQENHKRVLIIGIIFDDITPITDLLRTVDFIIEDNRGMDKDAFSLIIYLSTCNAKTDADVGSQIHKRYPEYYATGSIRIVMAPSSVYKQEGIIEGGGCTSIEIRRRKEAVDFAFLFQYASRMSLYFVQYETGIHCVKYVIDKMLQIIRSQKQMWYAIDFGHLGFIGTLFHSSFLPGMAEFLISHYKSYSSDFLLSQLMKSVSEKNVIYTQSSPCIQKDMEKLKDKFTPVHPTKKKNIPLGDNPPAKLSTNMIVFKSFSPVKAYDNNNDTFMWCNSVKNGHFLRFSFVNLVNISRILVITGSDDGSDMLMNGFLQVSVGLGPPCERLLRRGVFVGGSVDTREQGVLKFPSNVNCVSIDIIREQTEWLMIREVRIYLNN